MSKEGKDNELKEFLKLFFELGQLKQIKRAGWNLIGFKDGETIAEHSHRAAIIAFFLAQYEDADPYKSAAMCLLHDVPETRTGDHHKVTQRYVDRDDEKILKDQLKNLPQWASDRVLDNFKHYAKDTSKEGTVARDADFLEVSITAKECIDRGFPDAIDWINNVDTVLRTVTAKKLNKMVYKSDSNSWWKGLKKITR